MSVDLTDPAAVRLEAKRRQELRAAGVSSFSTLLEEAKQATPRRRAQIVNAIVGPVEHPVRVVRWIDGLQATIAGPARTKKNGGAGAYMGITQRPAYRQFRDRVVNGFFPLLARLNLPLADRDYNLRATFYVDVKGEQADLVGLLQGLADALENAGVVSNDRWFRGFDRSRMIAGEPRPRVELLISPLDA